MRGCQPCDRVGDSVCDHPTSISLSLHDRDAQQKIRNTVENVGGTTGVELLCLDLSMPLAGLQMQYKSVGGFGRGPDDGPVEETPFCFHVLLPRYSRGKVMT